MGFRSEDLFIFLVFISHSTDCFEKNSVFSVSKTSQNTHGSQNFTHLIFASSSGSVEKRMRTTAVHNLEKQNPEWTKSQIGRNPKRKKSRIGQNPELDKILNEQNPEWTKSRMDKIPNWTISRMKKNPELDKTPHWIKSRIEPTSK